MVKEYEIDIDDNIIDELITDGWLNKHNPIKDNDLNWVCETSETPHVNIFNYDISFSVKDAEFLRLKYYIWGNCAVVDGLLYREENENELTLIQEKFRVYKNGKISRYIDGEWINYGIIKKKWRARLLEWFK